MFIKYLLLVYPACGLRYIILNYPPVVGVHIKKINGLFKFHVSKFELGTDKLSVSTFSLYTKCK